MRKRRLHTISIVPLNKLPFNSILILLVVRTDLPSKYKDTH